MIRFLLIIGTAAQITAIASAERPLVAITTDEGVQIQQGNTPVLHYQRSVKSLDGKWPRSNYVHPLYDLDGQVITEDFPADHRHHRGIFWAWHQVLVGEQRLGDAWVCKDFQWDVQTVETAGDDHSQSITSSVLWKSSDYVDDQSKPIPVVRETTKITVHRNAANHRFIDFEISLRALVDEVKIGGSDDVKGYGGFSPRIKLDKQQQFVSASGNVEPLKTAIKAGSWINITDRQHGIAVLAHASNPEPNDLWILRRKNSMQNAVFPGRKPVALSKLKPTMLKYRLVIHRGALTRDQATTLQREFSQ